MEVVIRTHSVAETRALAARLAARLEPGDVLILDGDLGAGKTHFTQGLAAELGIVADVTSPTFNLLLEYNDGKLPLNHFDLYRLESAQQLEDIDFAGVLESGGISVIEWGSKFPLAMPTDAVRIFIAVEGDHGRKITLSANEPRSVQILEQAFADGADVAESECVLQGQAACSSLHAATDVAHTDAAGLTVENPAVFASDGVSESRETAKTYVLAFDTSNEVIAVGVGRLDAATHSVELVAERALEAHRASNTQLLPTVDALLTVTGVRRQDIACVAVGRGPGSFTGVRIAMATAKGIASALGVGLVGLSTLDAIAWQAQAAGVRGRLLVLADAMRKEVYPAQFVLSDSGIERLGADSVIKAQEFADELIGANDALADYLSGDGLEKYGDMFEAIAPTVASELWTPTGAGLLLALQESWREGECNPFDTSRHNPAFALPVYTRLSDAEENEKQRLARNQETLAGMRGSKHVTMNDTAISNVRTNSRGIAYKPLDAAHVGDVAALESVIMGSDAWNEALVTDELGRPDRIWWAAFAAEPSMPLPSDAPLVGYAGGWVVDGDVQILKVGVHPDFQRRGIARELLARVGGDAFNLNAATSSLEVRASNEPAQKLYEALGYVSLGTRPRYYSDGEDALIMKLEGLPESSRDLAGMELIDYARGRENVDSSTKQEAHAFCGVSDNEASAQSHPFILAIESSCDETAAAVVDRAGELLSDVVASQVDFHARFGGVVPEIASRKHIEAICGVCEEALARAGYTWAQLDAVAATYAPGLVGALVVGVAFAKGAAWALDVPYVGVNHLEGHLYANKIDAPGFAPPAVVSLVSGGNTMLVYMKNWGCYQILGTTIDDAVGEAFDKVAKALGLGYPGGPVISREAAKGNADAIPFPRAMLHSGDLRFSLSGLKTAVVTYINGEREAGRELNIPDIAASFQQAVVDVQIAKARKALEETGAPTFCLGGGVAANPVLRQAYKDMCANMDVRLVMPPLSSCGDNAGMIALVALDRFNAGRFFSLDSDALAHADLEVEY